MQTRRLFLKVLALKMLGATALSAAVIPLAACARAPQQPVPFRTGQAVSPPLGCTELRSDDPEADCE